MQYYCVTGSADGDTQVWVHLSSSVLILACLESNTPSPPLQIVAGLDNGSIYRYVLLHFSLSYSVDLKGSMDRWDLLIGQKRPLD